MCVCVFVLIYAANLFASGSRDGVILLWSTNSLSAMKMFHSVDTISQPIKDTSGPSLLLVPDTTIRQILAVGEVCKIIFSKSIISCLTPNDLTCVIKPLFQLTLSCTAEVFVCSHR